MNNIQFNKYEGKGLSGLANIGNSCYLNACMQIFSHIYELNEFLNPGDYKKKINRKPESVILLEWDKLREMMWRTNCTIAPYGFVKAIQKVAQIKDRNIFSGHAQNDIQEFLLFIVDCFHEALAREVEMHISGDVRNSKDLLAKECYEMMREMYKKEYSEILGMFYGIHVSEITSSETGDRLSLRPEPFSVLSLPIPNISNNITLYDCMDEYCKKEELKGENAWFNDKLDQKQDVNRGIIFWSLPEILIIDLKRWGDRGQKIHKLVDVPIDEVNFTKYVKGYDKNSYIYDLFGVCNHSGGSLGGHYTSFVKNANGKWYEFNDTLVREVESEKIISHQSYCFFYRKKKISQ
tara:strand:+ start:14062 stop:15111 length:1050 start_codon:yes stop_codon:yes gene_type:complete